MPFVDNEFTADQSYTDYSSVEKVSVFGAEDDLWGATFVEISELTDPSFEIIFDADVGQFGTMMVDSVEIEIFYQVPTGIEDPEEVVKPPYVPSPWASVALGRGPTGQRRIVCVGDSGQIEVSDDGGDTWSDRDSGCAVILWGVTWDGDVFTACGELGTIVESVDGETWTIREEGITSNLYAIGRDKKSKSVVVGGRNGALHARYGLGAQYKPGRAV